MRIEKNKVVLVTYDLTVDGQLVDSANEEQPLDYIQGMHMLIPKFEEALEGLEEGAIFAFTIQPEDGYGAYDEKRRFDLPKTAFTIKGELREDLMQVGRILPMVGADGSIVNATVVEVKENGVTMDFNHPMAGKVLLPPEEGHHCCGKGKGHCHHHEHEDGECCGHDHKDGECCGHDHKDGECCRHGHCHHDEE